MNSTTTSNSTISELPEASDLPYELLFKILHHLRDDPETSNAASLVKTSWRIFQSAVFSHYKLPNTPTDELSPLQELATTGTQHDQDHELSPLQELATTGTQHGQDRLLSFIRSVRFGSPWSLEAQASKGFKLAQNTVHPDHIHILERIQGLTTLEFASSCFKWIDLDDEQLRGLLRVLRQPNLTEVSSSYFPGGYIPLCLFLFSPNLTTLKLEDNSLEPVDEMSVEAYRYLKGRLLHLYSQFPQAAVPTLSVQELKLKGLGLINSFLRFAKGLDAIRIALSVTCMIDQPYFVLLTSPDSREVLGNFLKLVGGSVEEFRVHIEREPVVNGILLNPSLGSTLTAGLGQLHQLKTFDISLTVYTTTAARDQEPERVVAFATSWLMSTFQALPGDKVTDIRITYRFGLRPVNNPTHELVECRRRFKQALDSGIREALDHHFSRSHIKLLRGAIQIIFLHGNTLTALRYDPGYDDFKLSKTRVCISFPECAGKGITFNTTIWWEESLLR
ncbi:hypothetical protein AN958_01322 [Leucoagaricus sp. SymC.cos]|nr:hypothetical protein AN958_01322 [Leucoagaricus sp. SymC.cos]